MQSEPNIGANAALGSKPEIRLKAGVVSRGIAVGSAVCIHGSNRQYFRISLGPDEIETEVERLNSAVVSASKKLESLISAEPRDVPTSSPGIFEAHMMILSDSSFLTKIEETLRSLQVNAEWAVKKVSDEYIAKYRSLPDEYLRERYIDIEDVSERLLSLLGGGRSSVPRLSNGSVIVAKELRPSTLVEFDGQKPLAIITEHGGWTSHTFILAREIGIPAVTGLQKILRRTDTGDRIIVDGYRGLVIINPTSETEQSYKVARLESGDAKHEEDVEHQGPVKTLDGKKISLFVNADNTSPLETAYRAGAEGVGLFRSEYLFNLVGGFPSQITQYEAYRDMAEASGQGGVRIRTFDIGISQVVDRSEDRERNPALGLRAIRLGLTYSRDLKTQLRAILQASFNQNVSIVIPMVTTLTEVRRFKEILASEREKMIGEKVDVGDPQVGAMIEVPAAVAIADKILEEVEFLCLGTNDLIQYYLAADRDNETVAAWYQSLHPAVIQAIGTVIHAADDAGKPLLICGEIAGSPFYVPILIGLGATGLSMNTNVIPRVRKMIEGIAYDEAHKLAKSLRNAGTAEEIEELVLASVREKWAHLVPDDLLPTS